MKKLIVALLILLPAVAYSAGFESVIPMYSAYTPVGGDGCGTDSLVLSWHMESTDITSGDPPGCVAEGFTATVTLESSAALSTAISPIDGTYSLYLPSGFSDAQITTTLDLLTEFKITGYIQVNSFVLNEQIFSFYRDSSNYAICRLKGSSTDISFGVQHKSGNTGTEATLTTTNANRIEDTWYYFEVEWKANTGGNDTYVKLCDSDGTSNCDEGTASSGAGVSAGAPSYFYFGPYSGTATLDGYIDNVKIYTNSQF